MQLGYSYNRFSKYLAEVAERDKDKIERIGVEMDQIGDHSICKVAETYVSSGTTAVSSIAAMCIRPG